MHRPISAHRPRHLHRLRRALLGLATLAVLVDSGSPAYALNPLPEPQGYELVLAQPQFVKALPPSPCVTACTLQRQPVP